MCFKKKSYKYFIFGLKKPKKKEKKNSDSQKKKKEHEKRKRAKNKCLKYFWNKIHKKILNFFMLSSSDKARRDIKPRELCII